MSEYNLDKNYNIKVSTESGNTYNVFANRLDNHKLTNFKNWLCESGSSSLFVSFNDDIYSGQCLNDKLGTVDNFKIYDEPTICNRSRCTGCTTDLMMKKYSKE